MTLPPSATSIARRKPAGRFIHHHHPQHRRRVTTAMALCMFLLLIVVVAMGGASRSRFFASSLQSSSLIVTLGSTEQDGAHRLAGEGQHRLSFQHRVREEDEDVASPPVINSRDADVEGAQHQRNHRQQRPIASSPPAPPPLLTTRAPSATQATLGVLQTAHDDDVRPPALSASRLVATDTKLARAQQNDTATTSRHHSTASANGTHTPVSATPPTSTVATTTILRTFPPVSRGRVLPQRGVPSFWSHNRNDPVYDTIGEGIPEKSSLALGTDGRYFSLHPSSPANGTMPAAASVCGPWAVAAENTTRDEAVASDSGHGEPRVPIDSVVWLAFNVVVTTNSSDATTALPHHDQVAAAANLAKQHIIDAMSSPPAHEASDYHTFFDKYNATLSVEDGGALVPLQLDVVYTYVNNTSPSHLAHTTGSGNVLLNNDPSRFRDWNELIHSMRAVYRYGVCLPNSVVPQTTRAREDGTFPSQTKMTRNGTQENEASSGRRSHGAGRTPPPPPPPPWCVEGEMIRKIFLVVADPDQAPSWLRQEHPLIEVVAHKDIFPAEDAAFLPTFNSHAIESALHRIPGLSRFYVYFNNDMFWGRSVSWFDYFRPLSQARQAHRVQRLGEATRQRWEASGRVHFGVDGIGQHATTAAPPSAAANATTTKVRVTVAMEPILYFEGPEDVHDCRAWPKPPYRRLVRAANVPPVPTTEDSNGGNASDAAGRATATQYVREEPTYQKELYGAVAFLPVPASLLASDNVTASSAAASTAVSEKQWEERCSQTPLQTGEIFDFKCPPRGRYLRARLRPENIWRTFVDNNKALAFKRLDGGHWPTHSFAHIPRLMDRQLMADMEDRVLADIAQRTRRSRERTVDSLWTTHLHQWHALALRRQIDRRLLIQLSTAAGTGAGATSADNPRNNSDGRTRGSTPPPSWRAPPPGSAVSMLAVHPFAADELSNQFMGHPLLRYATSQKELHDVAHRHNDRGNGNNTISDRNATELLWRQHTVVEASSSTSLLEEKLNHHVVRLDRKRGGYYFCMMKTLAAQARCLTETVGSRETLGGVQLFVTVNDDFPRLNKLESLFHRAYSGAQRLFEGLTGHAPPAPWEKE